MLRHTIDKDDTSSIALEEAPYEMQLQIIYNITEGDPPETTEYTSEPSRFYLYNPNTISLLPYNLLITEEAEKYIVKFYRNLHWYDEDGVTNELPSTWSLINYVLVYKGADGVESTYEFDDSDATITYDQGLNQDEIALVVESDKDDEDIVLEYKDYQFDLYIKYGIEDEDSNIEEFYTSAARFFYINKKETLSYIFDADNYFSHPKFGKWQISFMVASGNGKVVVVPTHKEIEDTHGNMKDYTFFDFNVTEIGLREDNGDGSAYNNNGNIEHTVTVDEYENIDGNSVAKAYIGFEAELVGVSDAS